MKNLLSMAQQKKALQPPVPPKMAYPQQMPYDDDYSEEGELMDQQIDDDYEPPQQDILEYAQFLGIDPIRQKDLMYIAKEGLVAPLPKQWKPYKNRNQEVYYVNVETGQKIWEHPCDEYYQQLVQKERAKKLNKEIENKTKAKELKNQNKPLMSGGFNSGLGMGVQMQMPLDLNKQKSKPIDPLLKMEQQKKYKKLQEQSKQEFQKKKAQLDKKYQEKRESLAKFNQTKEDSLRSKYSKEEEEAAASNRKKQSDKYKSQQDKFDKELEQYRNQLRSSLQETHKQRLKAEAQSLEQSYRLKREEARRNTQTQFKKKKKQLQQDFAQEMKQLDEKEKQLKKTIQPKQNNFQKQIDRLKQQHISEKIASNNHLLEQQRQKQDKVFRLESQKLLEKHNQRVAAIEKEGVESKTEISLEPYVRELEETYAKKVKLLELELASFRQLNEVELQKHLVDFQIKMQQAYQEKRHKILKEASARQTKEVEKVNRQFELKLSQIEKKANDDYLRGLRDFQERFDMEQQTVLGSYQNQKAHKKDNQNEEEQQIDRLNREIQELHQETTRLRKLLSKIQLQCQNSKSHLQRQENDKGPLYGRLSAEQRDLYDLIGDKERINIRQRKEQQLQ